MGENTMPGIAKLRRNITLILVVVAIGVILWWKPEWLFVLGPAVEIAVLLCILWWFPKWQAKTLSKEDLLELGKLENEFHKTVAQIIGGILLLAGLSFTWLEMSITSDQLKNTSEQLLIAREGQITERFTRSIAQLGNKD